MRHKVDTVCRHRKETTGYAIDRISQFSGILKTLNIALQIQEHFNLFKGNFIVI